MNTPTTTNYLCPFCKKLCITDNNLNQSSHEHPACEQWLKDQLAKPGARLTHVNSKQLS